MKPSPIRAAFTLLEMLIAVAILGTVLSIATRALTSGSGVSTTMTAAMQADDQAKKAVGDIVTDLRSAQANTPTATYVTALPNGTGVSVRVCTSISGGTPTYGSVHQYVYDSAAGTLTKIVDFGLATETRTVLLRGLPAGAFSVVAGGSNEDEWDTTLVTQFTDASGIVHSITTIGRAFMRSGLIPDGSSGGSTPPSSTPPSSTPPSSTPPSSTPPSSTPPSSTPPPAPVVNNPTVTISGTRSNAHGNTVDVTGSVRATVPTGDSVGTITVTIKDSSNAAQAPTLTPSGSGVQQTVSWTMVGVNKNKTYTVTATATSASGGSTTTSTAGY